MSRASLPQNYIMPGAVLLNDCSDASEWSQQGGNPIAFIDSTDHNIEGTGSQKLIIPAAAATGLRINSLTGMGWNLTRNLISFKIGSNTTPSNRWKKYTFSVLLSSNVGSRFSDFISSRALFSADKWPDDIVTLDIDSAIDFNQSGGTFDRSSVQWCSIQINNTDSTDEKLFYLDGIYNGLRGIPKVILTMDDGDETVYTALFPLTQARGIVGTLFINGSTIGNAGKLTKAQLTEMQTAGWLIANHCYTHTGWYSLTKAQMTEEFETNKQWMLDNGFPDWNYFAFVGGQFNDNGNEVLEEQKVLLARGVENNLNDTFPNGGFSSTHDSLSKYWMRTDNLGETFTETASVSLGYLDDCLKLGYSQASYGHKIVTTPTLTTEFATAEMTALLDGLATRRNQGLIDIVTFKQFNEGLEGVRPSVTSRAVVTARPVVPGRIAI